MQKWLLLMVILQKKFKCVILFCEILYLWYCQFKDNIILLDKDLVEQTFYSRIFVDSTDLRFANKDYKNYLIKQAKK